MKVTIKNEYLEIKKNEDDPILCIDKEVAGILLYELFDNGIESMKMWYDSLMKLINKEKDD